MCERSGRLFVLSGPSGVGKDAALVRLKELGRPYHFTVTATTRPKRPGEVDGVDYIFLTRDRFEEMVDTGGFLEWSEVYGNLYGVPSSQVTGALALGRSVILKIDVQGAATIRALYPDSTLIFLEAPDFDSLESRLSARDTETASSLRLKLKTVRAEMECVDEFDHRVTNRDGHLDEAVHSIDRIVSGQN